MSLLDEVRAAMGKRKFNGPVISLGKPFQIGNDLATETATSNGVYKQQIRSGGGVAQQSVQFNLQKGTKVVPAGGIEPTA